MSSSPVSVLADQAAVESPRSSFHPRASLTIRLLTLMAVAVPPAGLIVAILLLWGVALDGVHLAVFAAMYLLTGFGVTVGFHRLFTHRSFSAHAPTRATLAVLGSMAVEGPVLKWVAQHRRHHQHSDHDDDPHSPHLHGGGILGMLRGLWHAHAGWLFDADPAGLERYVGDLLKDRVVRVVSRLFVLWAALGLLIPALLGGLLTMSWMGVLLGLLWGGLVRIFLVHHVTWSINSVCHLWGYQAFRSDDESRNNIVFGMLAMGEGWHNNHHAFPTSARHGLRWWELDGTYLVIRLMSLCGLAWNVRTPDVQTIARRRK